MTELTGEVKAEETSEGPTGSRESRGEAGSKLTVGPVQPSPASGCGEGKVEDRGGGLEKLLWENVLSVCIHLS